MKKILMFCFVLTTYNAMCQDRFLNEPQSFSKEDVELNNMANKQLKLNDDFQFEFRFWTEVATADFKTVFILRKTDDFWNAYYLERNRNKTRSKQIKANQDTLKLLWSQLIDNKVLTLRTQDSIKYLMRTYLPDTTLIFDQKLKEVTYSSFHVVDGIGYTYQLFNSNSARSYSYHCPLQYLKKYPNIEELYRAYVIAVLIRKFLNLDMEIC